MRALFALLTLLALFAAPPAFAQRGPSGQPSPTGAPGGFAEPGQSGEPELDPGLGEIEIEEEPRAPRGSAFEAFRKYVFATVGGSYVIGSGSSRESYDPPETEEGDNSRVVFTGSVGVDFQTDFFQFYAQGTIWDQEIEITQEIENRFSGGNFCSSSNRYSDTNQCDPSIRTLKIEEDDTELSEGYFSVTPLSWLRLRVGRRKVVWGQFDVFSPVDLLLPFRTQSTDPYFTKVNFRRPQDHAQLSITPHERIELQGYWFYNTRIDPLLTRLTAQESGISVSLAEDRLEDHDQFAARLLFYPNWGTLGLTWYRGRHSLRVNDFTRYMSTDPVADLAMTNDRNRELAGSFFDSPDLAELDAYALEFSARRGRWLFRTEVVYRDSTGDLDELRSPCGFGCGDNEPRRRYLRWVLEENDGKFYGDLRTIMAGIGFKYESEKWLVDIALLALSEEFVGDAKRGADLNDEALGDDPAAGTLAAPFINIARYFGRDKTVTLGFTAGFVGAYGAGASLYTVFDFDQLDRFGIGAFQLVLGVDGFQYNTDTALSDLNDMGDLYDLKDDFIVGPRVGLVWKF
ncbi:MAG: hypothetical protein OXU78_08805 [Deltaproteobacteria bacterium]|nr:hypothetical protein [Deltaproteobacteria bacterium]